MVWEEWDYNQYLDGRFHGLRELCRFANCIVFLADVEGIPTLILDEPAESRVIFCRYSSPIELEEDIAYLTTPPGSGPAPQHAPVRPSPVPPQREAGKARLFPPPEALVPR